MLFVQLANGTIINLTAIRKIELAAKPTKERWAIIYWQGLIGNTATPGRGQTLTQTLDLSKTDFEAIKHAIEKGPGLM